MSSKPPRGGRGKRRKPPPSPEELTVNSGGLSQTLMEEITAITRKFSEDPEEKKRGPTR